jgi:predicted DNA-binding transcriptional regulator AlpA
MTPVRVLINPGKMRMSTRFLKASEIAERFRVSRDAVYLWIRLGRIPSECVIRIAGTVRVDEQKFENLLLAGSLHSRVGQNTRDETVQGANHHLAHLEAEEARQKAEQHLAGCVQQGGRPA